MKLFRFSMWLLRGIVVLAVAWFSLIVIDFIFFPEWLTEYIATLILILVLLIYFLLGIIKIKRNITHRIDRDNNIYSNHRIYKNNNIYKTNNSYRTHDISRPDVINRPHKMSIVKPVLVVLVTLVVLSGGYVAYKQFTQPDLENVPDEILELGDKYPEAREYVENFNKYYDKDFDMDVSKEMAEKDIPLFIQWDKRWGYKNYGENYIGVAGCGPTCLAMVVCGLENDSDINPYIVANFSYEQGYYTYGQGTSWNIMTEGASHYGLTVDNGRVSSDYILDNLSSQTPMICSMAPGDFTTSGHFIVLTGIDEDGKIIVNDPNSPRNSKKHWDVEVLVSQMKSIWKYEL